MVSLRTFLTNLLRRASPALTPTLTLTLTLTLALALALPLTLTLTLTLTLNLSSPPSAYAPSTRRATST